MIGNREQALVNTAVSFLVPRNTRNSCTSCRTILTEDSAAWSELLFHCCSCISTHNQVLQAGLVFSHCNVYFAFRAPEWHYHSGDTWSSQTLQIPCDNYCGQVCSVFCHWAAVWIRPCSSVVYSRWTSQHNGPESICNDR